MFTRFFLNQILDMCFDYIVKRYIESVNTLVGMCQYSNENKNRRHYFISEIIEVLIRKKDKSGRVDSEFNFNEEC